MSQALAQLLPGSLFAVLLVFCRVGSALMLLPGFGDLYVPIRVRLLLAVLLAGLLTGVLAPLLPALPASIGRLAALVGGEVVIGLFFGTVARILMTALETAGAIVSYQLGLSAAQVFNPQMAQSGTVASAFLTVLGTLVIFLTNTHHLMLRGLVASYGVFPPGGFPLVGDLSDAVARIVASTFALAIELAAPFIVVGTLFFVALGLLSRLMPQLQVFFVILPVQIAGGLAILAVTLYAITAWFVDGFTQRLADLVPFQ